MKKKWGAMSPEEREQYANQDHVERDSREYLEGEIGAGKFRKLAALFSLADINTKDTSCAKVFTDILTPLELHCLIKVYVEKETYREVGEAITSQLANDNGKVISSTTLTMWQVNRIIVNSKEKIQTLLNDKKSLLVEGK